MSHIDKLGQHEQIVLPKAVRLLPLLALLVATACGYAVPGVALLGFVAQTATSIAPERIRWAGLFDASLLDMAVSSMVTL